MFSYHILPSERKVMSYAVFCHRLGLPADSYPNRLHQDEHNGISTQCWQVNRQHVKCVSVAMFWSSRWSERIATISDAELHGKCFGVEWRVILQWKCVSLPKRTGFKELQRIAESQCCRIGANIASPRILPFLIDRNSKLRTKPNTKTVNTEIPLIIGGESSKPKTELVQTVASWIRKFAHEFRV
jgi:hypothetical protein